MDFSFRTQIISLKGTILLFSLHLSINHSFTNAPEWESILCLRSDVFAKARTRREWPMEKLLNGNRKTKNYKTGKRKIAAIYSLADRPMFRVVIVKSYDCSQASKCHLSRNMVREKHIHTCMGQWLWWHGNKERNFSFRRWSFSI